MKNFKYFKKLIHSVKISHMYAMYYDHSHCNFLFPSPQRNLLTHFFVSLCPLSYSTFFIRHTCMYNSIIAASMHLDLSHW